MLGDLEAGDDGRRCVGTATSRAGSGAGRRVCRDGGGPLGDVSRVRTVFSSGRPLAFVIGSPTSLAPWDGQSAGGLVAGFLIGDTTGVAAVDEEALRLSGLSHFVAVSGSNVALFLMLWWVVVGPLALGPRRRAVARVRRDSCSSSSSPAGKSSVLRAASMAGIVLVARAVGPAAVRLVGPRHWGRGALPGGARSGLRRGASALRGSDPGGDGEEPGSLTGRLPKPVATTLSATVAAQVAVAPILLMRFGTVPLAAPLANLLAAPAVALATMAGSDRRGARVVASPRRVGRSGPLGPRRGRVAAGWPQLGLVRHGRSGWCSGSSWPDPAPDGWGWWPW